MTMSLAGRVAEIECSAAMSSGAAMSISSRCSKIARWMVCDLGMGSIVESRTLLAERPEPARRRRSGCGTPSRSA